VHVRDSIFLRAVYPERRRSSFDFAALRSARTKNGGVEGLNTHGQDIRRGRFNRETSLPLPFISGIAMTGAIDPTVVNLIVFVLAIFVGYHVIWNVTPALHTPLMSVTNAISSVIIVGAILAAGPAQFDIGSGIGALAVALAAINVAGGFLVTQRMLQMFRKKTREKPKD
jgi:H+-translocating NAD(P) transhydrogenase subunit alpha